MIITVTIRMPESVALSTPGILAHRLHQIGEHEYLRRFNPADHPEKKHLEFDFMDGESVRVEWVNS